MEHDQWQLERLALTSLTEVDCPAPDQLAAFILGTLVGTEQLAVAAHVRGCPLCLRDSAICRPAEPRQRRLIARRIPLAPAAGHRGAAEPTAMHHYLAGDLSVELRVAEPVGEHGRISGQIVRAGAGIAGRPMMLRAGRRRYQQTTDDQGFFTFSGVPIGRYTLTLFDEHVQVQIRNLALGLEAE